MQINHFNHYARCDPHPCSFLVSRSGMVETPRLIDEGCSVPLQRWQTLLPPSPTGFDWPQIPAFTAYAVLRFKIFCGMSNIDLGWVDMEHACQEVGWIS